MCIRFDCIYACLHPLLVNKITAGNWNTLDAGNDAARNIQYNEKYFGNKDEQLNVGDIRSNLRNFFCVVAMIFFFSLFLELFSRFHKDYRSDRSGRLRQSNLLDMVSCLVYL